MCSSVNVERFEVGEKELRLLSNQAVVASDSRLITLPKIATGWLLTVNIGTTVSSLVRISLADVLCREAGARSDCCTNMDKWLKRVNPPSRDTIGFYQ